MLQRLLLFALAVPLAHADLFTRVNPVVMDVSWPGSVSCEASGTSYAACASTGTLYDPNPAGPVPIAAVVRGWASASYGALHADVNMTVNPLLTTHIFGGGALASFTDELTITAGGHTGIGYVSYLIQGSEQLTSEGYFTVTVLQDGNGKMYMGDPPEGLGKGTVPSEFSTDPAAFHFGVPFTLSVEADAPISLEGDYGLARFDVGIAGIDVFDADHQRIAEYAFTSASGQFSMVPEPSAWALLATALIGIGIGIHLQYFQRTPRTPARPMQNG